MNFPKFFLITLFVLFGLIGTVFFVKTVAKKAKAPAQEVICPEQAAQLEPVQVAQTLVKETAPPVVTPVLSTISEDEQYDFPQVDRTPQLFSVTSEKLPFVETITYTTRTAWLKGRPAWISDYASHFQTSKHFIARSVNGKADYRLGEVSSGKKFNVFSADKKIKFHLLVDRTLRKMGLYCIDLETQERILLKTYRVCLGRPTATDFLTPIGTFSLGNKVAIYKPGVTGFFQDNEIEMLSVFGSRWIPMDHEQIKGLGIHGMPWVYNEGSGEWREDRGTIGQYESDGCIRLVSEDIEEIFSIVITKPTNLEIVTDFRKAQLPGVERL